MRRPVQRLQSLQTEAKRIKQTKRKEQKYWMRSNAAALRPCSGESVRAELRAAHCLTSLFAERVNEKLYEHFQDICLASEGEELFLMPDYREELETLLRETEK